MTAPHAAVPTRGRSVLRRRATWGALVLWATTWGTLTWGLEALILRMAAGAPREPGSGVYRLVEATLWIIPMAMAIYVAERWPITSLHHHWKRIAAQIALGLALGPIWGILAYGLSPYLMPWWRPRGMWGIVAKEAKAILFGYGTTALLAHVALRVVAQRRVALAFAQSAQRAAEVQLDLLRLQLQPDGVLRAMDGVQALIGQDVDAANAALVLLADSLDRAMDAASERELPLSIEVANIDTQIRLRHASGWTGLTCTASLERATEHVPVPRGVLQSLVEEVVAVAAAAGCAGLQVRIAADRDGSALRVALAAEASPAAAMPDLMTKLANGRALVFARERLGLLHHDPELPTWRTVPAGDAAIVRLTLPWREPAHAPPRQPGVE